MTEITTPSAISTPGDLVERDRWGRPLLLLPGDKRPKAFSRASSFAAVIENRFGLEKWQQRRVAQGLASRPDLVLMLRSKADNATLDEVIAQAMDSAGALDAARWGTTFHAMAHQLDATGEIPPALPEDMHELLEKYREVTSSWEMLGAEDFVANTDLMVAGSYDRLYRIGGVKVIADIKTGRDAWKYAHGSAVQFACYAHGTPYDPENQSWGIPLPDDGVDQEVAVMIHVDRPGMDVRPYAVDITVGWKMANVAWHVKDWHRQSMTSPLTEITGGVLK